MCCCRWLAVLQEALCYDVDSFDNTVPAGKKLWRQHSRYTFIIKRFHILPIFWCLFFVPGDCRGAELHDKLFKKNIFIPQFTASGLCWGAEKRPTVAVRCQHSFVMSTRADFQCSVCWCTVEEADWRRWQTRSTFTRQKTLRAPKNSCWIERVLVVSLEMRLFSSNAQTPERSDRRRLLSDTITGNELLCRKQSLLLLSQIVDQGFLGIKKTRRFFNLRLQICCDRIT